MKRHSVSPSRRPSLSSAILQRSLGTISPAAFRAAARTTLVPSHAFHAVSNPPEASLRRYTPCGNYLVALSRNRCDVLLYLLETGGARLASPETFTTLAALASAPRHAAPPARAPPVFDSNPLVGAPGALGRDPLAPYASPAPADVGLLARLPIPLAPPAAPAASCDFRRFFSHVYTVSLVSGDEVLVPDFCLATARHLVFASVIVVASDDDATVAVKDRIVLKRLCLHLVQTETGEVRDQFVLRDDYVVLERHGGVHMLGDLMCVLSIRHQVLHILQVQDATGRFVEVSRIGAFCERDDEMLVASAREAEARFRAASGDAGIARDEAGEKVAETGLGGGKDPSAFYSGLMHRLLAYVYRKHSRENNQRFFFRVVSQYSSLVMKKAQFLDDDHLLIRLGSSGALDPRSSTCFFLVYCISTTRVVNLFENRSADLLKLYETHTNIFQNDALLTAMRPRDRASSALRRASRQNILSRIRELLADIPVSAQHRNPSVYLDRRLFSYPVDKMCALDGSRALSMHGIPSVKFTAAGGGSLRFKLTPGPFPANTVAAEGSVTRPGKGKFLFLFHPTLPFVISMQATQAVPTAPLINFHVRDT